MRAKAVVAYVIGACIIVCFLLIGGTFGDYSRRMAVARRDIDACTADMRMLATIVNKYIAETLQIVRDVQTLDDRLDRIEGRVNQLDHREQ